MVANDSMLSHLHPSYSQLNAKEKEGVKEEILIMPMRHHECLNEKNTHQPVLFFYKFIIFFSSFCRFY
jgi:hypothetical protein